MAVLIGATMNEIDLPTYKTFLAGNNIMRIFPSKKLIVGKPMGVLPPWEDSRFRYCQDNGVIPFVSTKVDGDPDGLAHVRRQLLAMPDWITTLYVTDRHEPEGDVTAAQFQANFTAFLAMVDSLPGDLRARIRCGPVLTKTWTERTSGGNFDYGTYDPGSGDFFGVDMYVASGTAKAVLTPATLPTPTEFVKTFKAYRKSPADTRGRIWPEVGAVGMPDDLDGSARAEFILGLHRELATWTEAEQGWPFLGLIWWHATGKATGVVSQIGQRRDFPLHLRTVPGSAGQDYTDARVTVLPGDVPKPVAAYNSVYLAENPTLPSETPGSSAPAVDIEPSSDAIVVTFTWPADLAELAERVRIVHVPGPR